MTESLAEELDPSWNIKVLPAPAKRCLPLYNRLTNISL